MKKTLHKPESSLKWPLAARPWTVQVYVFLHGRNTTTTVESREVLISSFKVTEVGFFVFCFAGNTRHGSRCSIANSWNPHSVRTIHYRALLCPVCHKMFCMLRRGKHSVLCTAFSLWQRVLYIAFVTGALVNTCLICTNMLTTMKILLQIIPHFFHEHI